MSNILLLGNSWYCNLLWVDICAKPGASSKRKPCTKNMKARQVLGWGKGDKGVFWSLRYSILRLGSVPCLRTKTADTERPVLGTHPEPYTILLSSPEWNAGPLLQKAEKGVEGGYKQEINQRNQVYWPSKNGMGPAIVWCHCDLYTASRLWSPWAIRRCLRKHAEKPTHTQFWVGHSRDAHSAYSSNSTKRL